MEDVEESLKEKIELRLKSLGVFYEFVEKPSNTIHTADASKITGIDLSLISKNLVSKTSDGRFAVLVVPGNKKVDLQKAASALNASNVSLVPFDQAHLYSGFPPGGTPSIGFDQKMEVVLDEQLSKLSEFYCGGGSTKLLLKLKTQDVIKTNNAVVSSITKE